jgi:hypothetical protein
MATFNLNINIDKTQTIHSDGDPALWPLVGRLAAAAVPPLLSLTDDGQPPRPVVNISNVSSTPMSGLAHQIAEHAWFSELWSRTTERPLLVGESMDGRRFAVLNAEDPRLQPTAQALEDAIGNYGTALNILGWPKNKGKVVDWARGLNDDLARVDQIEDELAAVRATLEEAIGRTPDPARSTQQLALDLVEVLKAAVMRR